MNLIKTLTNAKSRQTILIDIDDTLVQSSQKIVDMLNQKNGTSKTIDDIKHFNYVDIDPTLTLLDVLKMYDDPEFYKDLTPINGVVDFIHRFNNIFRIVFVTRGTNTNLANKEQMIRRFAEMFGWVDIGLVNLPLQHDKSNLNIENVCLAIDDCSDLLDAINAPNKILFKNMLENDNNQVPPNREWYVANTWKEITDIVDFYL